MVDIIKKFKPRNLFQKNIDSEKDNLFLKGHPQMTSYFDIS